MISNHALELAQQHADYIRDNPLSPEEESEYEVFLDAIAQAESHTMRKQQRLHDCGKWGYYFDPHTGKQTGFTYSCDLFRECPICREKRANREKKWVVESYHRAKKNFLFVTAKDQQEANKLLRGVNKKQYVRYPQQSGFEYIFLSGELESQLDITYDVVTPDFLRELNWMEIVNTPEGRNKSGSMHTPVSQKNPEPFQIIEIEQFIPNAPGEIVDRAMQYAIAQTLDLLPEDAREVKEAIDQRVALAIEFLKENGYTVRTYSKKLKVIISRINWVKYVEFSGININVNTKKTTGKFDYP